MPPELEQVKKDATKNCKSKNVMLTKLRTKFNWIRVFGLLVAMHSFVVADVLTGARLGLVSTVMPNYDSGDPVAKSTTMAREAGGQANGMYKTYYQWSDQDLAYLTEHRMWQFSGQVSAGWMYDDNINLSHSGAQNKKTADSSFFVSPGISLNYGPTGWGFSGSLNYSTSFEWYLDGKAQDSVNHSLGLSLNWTGAKTRIAFSTAYSAVDGGDVDVGDRVQRNVMDANFSLAYDYSEKTTFGATFTTGLLDYSGALFSSNSYNVGVYADYKVTPKTSLGLGGGYGYTQVTGGVDYRSYNLNLRGSWAATKRLSIHATGGAQLTESPGFSETTPVFEFGLNYDIFGNGKTSASMSSYRSYHPSALLRNQAYWSNGVTFSVSRQVGARTQAALMAGYEFADYTATAKGVTATRSDSYFYLGPRLTYALTTRASLSVFYQYGMNNSSGFGSASFQRNAMGILGTYAF